jgi:hypothetical protein
MKRTFFIFIAHHLYAKCAHGLLDPKTFGVIVLDSTQVHAFGFGRGGLTELEAKLMETKASLESKLERL